MKVYFATGNSGKVRFLERLLGNGWEVAPVKLDIHEIQHADMELIAREKARTAFNLLNKPVVVEDGGLFINALGGFPGPYVKHLNETIGVKGLLKILENVEDRSCYWQSATAYIDESGKITTFTDSPDKSTSHGSIAHEIGEIDSPRAFSDLWKVYIPSWADKPGCYLSDEECDRAEQSEINKSAFGKLAQWLHEKY